MAKKIEIELTVKYVQPTEAQRIAWWHGMEMLVEMMHKVLNEQRALESKEQSKEQVQA